jgi:hypothetical protein
MLRKSSGGNVVALFVRGAANWVFRRHSVAAEVGLIVAFYAAYEATRGVVAGTRGAALHRAQEIADLERALHLFAEPGIQRAAEHVPDLLAVLSVSYVTLHLGVTAAALAWLYIRRPDAFPAVRTTLIVASALSLIGFLAFPTAPPRMAVAGLADSVSAHAVDLNHGLVSSLYNPYAAVPSMHVGYAAIVGAVLLRYGRGPWRALGVVYPLFVLLVIVATGNHFLFDAATGAAVALVSAALTLKLRPAAHAEIVQLRRPEAETSARAA